jgi:hypothetical protein
MKAISGSHSHSMRAISGSHSHCDCEKTGMVELFGLYWKSQLAEYLGQDADLLIMSIGLCPGTWGLRLTKYYRDARA